MQSAFTLAVVKAKRKEQSCHKLAIGNWNVTSSTRKKDELENTWAALLTRLCCDFMYNATYCQLQMKENREWFYYGQIG